MSEETRPTPPVSGRDAPRFRDPEHRRTLADAFQDQGEDYDRLRPDYPRAAIDAILDPSRTRQGSSLRIVDLGAGTGKLSWALARRGAEVLAVDPSRAMLDEALRAGEGSGARIRTHVAAAEDTGLPEGSADLVTVAQAWHWFDARAAAAEIDRVLTAGGILALVWNMLDVSVPWVHRLSRIMHAGDIHREDFDPQVPAPFTLRDRSVHAFEDPMPTQDVIDLARTRSYLITAPPQRREKVLANLDWYVHEHLGHAPGSTVHLPYRTDLFLYERAGNS